MTKSAAALLLLILTISSARADDEMAKFWEKYNEIAEKEDHVAAWNLLERGHGKRDANIHLSKGYRLLLGWGVERNKCRAALEFEEAERQGSLFAFTYLHYIYNGAWQQIAAEEGNPDALFQLAEAAWAAYQVGNPVTPFSKLLALEHVYRLYKRAELAGHPKASAQVVTIDSHIRKEKGHPPVVEPDFKRVICDVRVRR